MQSTSFEDPNTPKHDQEELLPDSPPTPETTPKPRRRGFAVMAPELVRQIARKGGIAAHAAGTAHEFTTDEARAAGTKGGRASHAKRVERTQRTPAK